MQSCGARKDNCHQPGTLKKFEPSEIHGELMKSEQYRSRYTVCLVCPECAIDGTGRIYLQDLAKYMGYTKGTIILSNEKSNLLQDGKIKPLTPSEINIWLSQQLSTKSYSTLIY